MSLAFIWPLTNCAWTHSDRPDALPPHGEQPADQPLCQPRCGFCLRHLLGFKLFVVSQVPFEIGRLPVHLGWGGHLSQWSVLEVPSSSAPLVCVVFSGMSAQQSHREHGVPRLTESSTSDMSEWILSSACPFAPTPGVSHVMSGLLSEASNALTTRSRGVPGTGIWLRWVGRLNLKMSPAVAPRGSCPGRHSRAPTGYSDPDTQRVRHAEKQAGTGLCSSGAYMKEQTSVMGYRWKQVAHLTTQEGGCDISPRCRRHQPLQR